MQGGIVLKKQSNLSRLLSYAGGHKYFTYVSWILSAVCALTALGAIWYIWKIINEVLKASPNFGSAQKSYALRHNGNGLCDYIVFNLYRRIAMLAPCGISHCGKYAY